MRSRAPRTTESTRTRPVRAGVAFSAAAALLAAPLVVMAESTPSYAAALELCAADPVSYPNIGNHPITQYSDQVTLYVGGDFTVAQGSTEAEGVVVVGGDAHFGMDSYYNLGVAGVGSRVPPSPMSTMLRVGGTLNITNGVLEVGHGIGGGVTIGQSLMLTPPASLETNGGALVEHAADALDDYSAWPANFQALSASLAALPDTATYTTDDGFTITGDGSTSQQVITVPGDQLGTIDSPSWLRLIDIPLGTQLIVNVTGAAAEVSMVSTFLGTSGSQVDPMAVGDTIFSQLTRSVIWNFVEATDVTLGKGSQLIGSVLVPQQNSLTKVMTSTNGRVYVAGDLVQGGPGVSGLEFHAYPMDCTLPPETGSFSVTKNLVNADGVTGLPASYTVEYSTNGGTSWTPLSVAAGATATVNGLPAGTVVQLRELAPTAVAGATWATPSWSADSVTIVVDDTVAATVTNTITEDEPLLGSFSVTKNLVNLDGVTGLPASYTVEYSIDGGTTWTPLSVAAGATETVTDLPEGTVVQLREVAPAAIAGATWATPSWSAENVSIIAEDTVTATVTNTITEDDPLLGSFSVSKTLVNADGVTGLPATYTVEYSIDGGATWVQLLVAAGATETVSNLPEGTVVQLREVAPAAVAGATWAAPSWTAENVTIIAGDTVVATVMNTITEDEVSPSFSTEAWVDNDGVTKTLPITGGLVVDRVWYQGLTPGVEYRFDGWLMLDDGGSGVPIGVTTSLTFTPSAANGTLLMNWPISADIAEANKGERIVIFLELYQVGQSIPVAVDLDINSTTEWFTIAAGEVLSLTGGELGILLSSGTGLLALGLVARSFGRGRAQRTRP